MRHTSEFKGETRFPGIRETMVNSRASLIAKVGKTIQPCTRRIKLSVFYPDCWCAECRFYAWQFGSQSFNIHVSSSNQSINAWI